MLIRIRHTCAALIHKKTVLSLETSSEINFEFIKFVNKRAIVALNRSPVLIYVHQSCSAVGNDLNHLVEGNQADLFCSTKYHGSRPCGFRQGFSCFPYIGLYKTCDPKGGAFLSPRVII